MRSPSSCLLFGSTLIALLMSTAAMAAPQAGSHELHGKFSLISEHPLSVIHSYHSYSDGYRDYPSDGKVTHFELGYGKFLTDKVEIGLSLSMVKVTRSNGSTAVGGIGLAPFVQGVFALSTWAGFFATGSLGYLIELPMSDRSDTVYTLGADLGVELFAAKVMSIRVGPAYQFVYQHRSYDDKIVSTHALGLSGAIVLSF